MAEGNGMDDDMYSHLWEPIQLGPTMLRNRLVDPAKTVLYADDHVIGDRHIWFYRERAKGGTGLIITEQQGAHPVAKGSFYMGCTAWEKRVIPRYERLAHAVHEFGARLFVQLYSPGIHDKGTMIMDEWHPLWAASAVPSSVHHEVPMVMGPDEIRSLVQGYGQSAANVLHSGLDGVEVHGAHSYQIGQFFSPYYNHRTDRYGGSPKKRCQLALEVGKEIRARVGTDITVGLRYSFDEFLDGQGITPEDAEEQIDHLASSGLFDYFSISGGAYPTLYRMISSMRESQGHMIPLARRAKEVVGDRARVFTVGRITGLDMANAAIADGSTDLVAMSRAHLADPFLARKAHEGREHEIIRCIGINECIGRLFDQREVVCALNPTTGREEAWGDGSLAMVDGADARHITVVGGGPAGMKTAAVAASRGHFVTLYERESELGGHINAMKRLPKRGEWQGAIDNFAAAMQTAGVVVHLGVDVTPEALIGAKADSVVIATGSHWDGGGRTRHKPTRPVGGTEQSNVLDLGTAVQRAVDTPHALGSRVVILDETGTYMPLGLAELLADSGIHVDVVSPNFVVGEDTLRTLDYQRLIPILKRHGVGLHAQHYVDGISGVTVVCSDVWTEEPWEIGDVDTLVLSLMRVPDDGLYQAVLGQLPDVRRVGDVVAPRKLSAVVYEGEALGREL